MSVLLAFLSGVGVSVAGVLVASYLQRRRDLQQKVEAARFEIYLKLLELESRYFWLCLDEEANQDIYPEMWGLSWSIADALRRVDRLEFADRVLQILFSNRYASPSERAEALRILIDNLGAAVNPRYVKSINLIREDNKKYGGRRSNAPGGARMKV